MKMYFILKLILLSATWSQISSLSRKVTGKEATTIYYDEDWNPVPMISASHSTLPTFALKSPNLRFGPLPCECQSLTCGCCVNMNIQLFNFQRHACTNFTYDPYEFSVGMNMLWNEESIFNRSISGKNPPPICMQAPIPYLPTMDQCVRIFNIFTPGRNIHMCMNLETRIERVPVLVLQFDCMRMGADGVALVKPEDEGGLNPPETSEETSSPPPNAPQEAENVFDTVDPDKKKKDNQTMAAQGNETVPEVPTVVVLLEEQMEPPGNESSVVNSTSGVDITFEGNEIEISVPMNNSSFVMTIKGNMSSNTEITGDDDESNEELSYI